MKIKNNSSISAIRNLLDIQVSSFDSSANSSVPIKSVIRKGRERICQQQKNKTTHTGRRHKILTPELIQRDSSLSTNYSSSHQEYDDVDLNAKLLISADPMKKVETMINLDKNSKSNTTNLFKNEEMTYENRMESTSISTG